MITSDILTKIVRPGLIPVGYIMNIAGKIIKDQRIELLGHYLSCSGKDYVLDYTKLSKAFVKGYPIDVRITDSTLDNAYIVNFCDRHLDQILGKFYLINKENNTFSIKDSYRFYPWNGKYNSFTNSTNDDWAYITITIRFDFINNLLNKILSKITHRSSFYADSFISLTDTDGNWNKINKIKKSNKHYNENGTLLGLQLYLSVSKYLEVNISDKLFYFLGKPFNVVTEEFSFPEEFYKIWNKATKGDSYGNKSVMGNGIPNDYSPL